jgi:hypothetical protein
VPLWLLRKGLFREIPPTAIDQFPRRGSNAGAG